VVLIPVFFCNIIFRNLYITVLTVLRKKTMLNESYKIDQWRGNVFWTAVVGLKI